MNNDNLQLRHSETLVLSKLIFANLLNHLSDAVRPLPFKPGKEPGF